MPKKSIRAPIAKHGSLLKSIFKPMDSNILMNTVQTGIEFQRQGKYPEAERQYQLVLRQDPSNAAANNLMGTLAIEARALDIAIDYFKKALKKEPHNPNFLNNTGNAFEKVGDYQSASEYLKSAIDRKPDFIEAITNLARVYKGQLKGELAIAEYQKALDIDPSSLVALTGLADIQLENGMSGDAQDTFTQLLALDPQNVRALSGLAHTRKFKPDDPHLAKVKDALKQQTLSGDQRSLLHHAAGKILNDQRYFPEAIDQWSKGKKASGYAFKTDVHRQQYDAYLKAFDKRFFAERISHGHSTNRPVFIVGMPRSGTTLTEQICASHPSVYGAGELSKLHSIATKLKFGSKTPELFVSNMQKLKSAEAAELAEQYLDTLNEHDETALRVIDKMPHNYELLPLIALLFPNARIVHCRRDPMDNCVSCFAQNFSEAHGYNADLTSVGLYYRQYKRMMDRWSEVVPLSIHDMLYEETVADLERSARGLIDFLGLEWSDKCLEFYKTERTVSTPSKWQVRQPIYSSSVKRWKRYGSALDPLKKALGELASEG